MGSVCTEMRVRACVVCYIGGNHMVSLFSSLTTCRIARINRRALLVGEDGIKSLKMHLFFTTFGIGKSSFSYINHNIKQAAHNSCMASD